MPPRRGGRSGGSSSRENEILRDGIYDWFSACVPPPATKLPNYHQVLNRLVDECIERGLNSTTLHSGNWQAVLYEGTIRMIQGDPTPGPDPLAPSAPPPSLWTPSKKHARSASSDLYSLPDFGVALGTPTPAPGPSKRSRWGDEPLPSTFSHSLGSSLAPGPEDDSLDGLLGPLTEALVSDALTPGSLAAKLSLAARARLLSLLGAPGSGAASGVAHSALQSSLPFAGPSCPKCLPQGIYHATNTFCPTARVIRLPPSGGAAAAVPPAGRLANPRSYAVVASAPTGKSSAPAPAAPAAGRRPSATTRSLRQCTKQGTKLTRVVYHPPPSHGLPPAVPDIRAAFQGFLPPLKNAELTLRHDVVLSFGEALSETDHTRVVARVAPLFTGGTGEVLNRRTSALLKFPLVPTHLPDGSALSADQLHGYITAHPKWADVPFVQRARFVTPASKTLGLSATVLVEIADDRASSLARRLLQTDISFGGAVRRARPWSIARPAPQCGICLKWGHSSHRCASKVAWCSRCASNHDMLSHGLVVKSSTPLPLLCVNCHGAHSAVDRECPFFKARFDEKELMSLQKKRRARVKESRTRKRSEKSKDKADVAAMLVG